MLRRHLWSFLLTVAVLGSSLPATTPFPTRTPQGQDPEQRIQALQQELTSNHEREVERLRELLRRIHDLALEGMGPRTPQQAARCVRVMAACPEPVPANTPTTQPVKRIN